MRVAVLSSGSKGNSTVIDTGSSEGSIIIDAGLSGKKFFERFDHVEAEKASVRAIFITHDHRDHISGAGILARKLKVPVYIHKRNFEASSDLFTKCEIVFISGEFSIGNIAVRPFEISHDGTENHAFSITYAGKTVTHLTDIGKATPLVRQRIGRSSMIVLESNHDPKMLKEGPYPWYLKQRISGNRGHLSNRDASELVTDIWHEGLENIILAHLSEENNDPSLAFDNMVRIRDENGFRFGLNVAMQHQALEFITV